jgi:hypothetical protein
MCHLFVNDVVPSCSEVWDGTNKEEAATEIHLENLE